MHQITEKGPGYTDEVGTICVTNFLPYVGKIVKVYVENGETFTVYEPSGIDEARECRDKVFSHLPKGESEEEKRISEARDVVWQLAQQSWLDGIPEDATIFCDAHQRMRPAHGANRYELDLLCNDCTGRVEEEIAKRFMFDIHAWVVQQAVYNRLHSMINDIEAGGYGTIQLDGNRWIELSPLYKFVRGHKPDSVEKHYPPNMYPTFYEGWVRHDKEPGIETIYFTSRNKLFNYLLNGGVIKEEEKVPHPMDDDEDDIPHHIKDLLKENS